MTIIAGIDIGGTKCAACLGRVTEKRVELLARKQLSTPPAPDRALAQLGDALAGLVAERGEQPAAVGISCGGPLDSRAGLVLSPPNLPGWDRVDVVTPFRARLRVPAALQDDANAGALAEWRWGAGRGCRSMVFLTFGAGMGAGLILDGRLYSGTNDMAGEVGHMRLSRHGPRGYGKRGSFEGFCSGGGIARMAQARALDAIQTGTPPSFCATFDDLDGVTAERVALAGHAGDALALDIWDTVGEFLGRGLAALVDVLNPERIVMGGIYGRQRALLEPAALRALRAEAHPRALAACEIVPAALGEHVGDFAGLAAALWALENTR